MLQKFLQLHQQETKPLPIHVNVKDVSNTEAEEKEGEDKPNIKAEGEHVVKNKVLNLLPATLKKRGNMLIDHLLSHPSAPSWRWNEVGELIYNG